MTRKGKLPIAIPNGVEVSVTGNTITVKGPKGQLQETLKDGIVAKIEEKMIFVSAVEAKDENRKFVGLYRTLIDNMVLGTTQGFEKRLEMIGVGYRANVQGKDLNLQVGFSHPTLVPIPENISVNIEKNTNIIISGVDKQQVGQYAAMIRQIRPPEPYQGKGIRYKDEYVRRKAGKAASKK